MILDTSAVVAIVLQETGFEALAARLFQSQYVGIGAPTMLEASMVLLSRLGKDARSEMDTFLRTADAQIIGFEVTHWRASAAAFEQYGKGRHPAALNFGDCLTYAVAKVAEQPLLFVGDDFTQTDLEPA